MKFIPADIPHASLKSMAKKCEASYDARVRNLQNFSCRRFESTVTQSNSQHVLTDVLTAKDGNQELFLYWLDPIDAIKRYIAKSQHSWKLYTNFEPETSFFRDIERAFGSRANSGIVFEAAQRTALLCWLCSFQMRLSRDST